MGTCAYWIGRPCRASPARMARRSPKKRSEKAGMAEKTLDHHDKRPERKTVAR